MKLGTALIGLAFVPALLATVIAGDSGPKVGQPISKFEVRDITGPNKGKTLCYV
jgi:hypothetical protein